MDLKQYHREVARTFPSDEQHGATSACEIHYLCSCIADAMRDSCCVERRKKTAFYAGSMTDEKRNRLIEKQVSMLNRLDPAMKTLEQRCSVDRECSAQARNTLHALAGVCGEIHEIAIVLAEDKGGLMLADEVGDILFYLTALCNANGITLEDAMRANVAKLRARYPDGFSADKAVNKDEAAEELAMGAEVRANTNTESTINEKQLLDAARVISKARGCTLGQGVDAIFRAAELLDKPEKVLEMSRDRSSPSEVGIEVGYVYAHKKSGSTYSVLHIATDATNSRDGNLVVVYRRYDPKTRECGVQVFVRDINEFREKFDCGGVSDCPEKVSSGR